MTSETLGALLPAKNKLHFQQYIPTSTTNPGLTNPYLNQMYQASQAHRPRLPLQMRKSFFCLSKFIVSISLWHQKTGANLTRLIKVIGLIYARLLRFKHFYHFFYCQLIFSAECQTKATLLVIIIWEKLSLQSLFSSLLLFLE